MDQNRLELGRAIRREVLGDAYVEQADRDLDQNDFIRPFRELTAEFVWGAIWSRPELDRRTRALLNIAILTALGRTDELKIYLGAPLDKLGITETDIREVILHCAVYSGFPSAVAAYRAAQEQIAKNAAKDEGGA